jgi:hypothetical protein
MIPVFWSFLAHAAPIDYKFPLPVWLNIAAGGVAVAISAPAAAIGLRTAETREHRSRDLYRLIRPLHLGAIFTFAFGLLFVWGFVGGFGAGTAEAHEFFENPITVLAWVDFWVGLGLLATLLGNVWDLVSPLNWLMRALDAFLARRGVAQRVYPAALGRWPAVVLVVVWSWMELVWDQAKNPPTLAAILLCYVVACLVGAALFGAEAWLDNVEVFTVMARTFGRVAPIELSPSNPSEWLATPRDEREIRLRPYGAGLRTEARMPAGGGAFVLALLATVIYDGFSQTTRFTQLAGKMIDGWSWLGVHTDVLRTIVMVGVVVLFVGLYVAVCGLMAGGRSAVAAASEYAPTLIPIAAVYFVAHYFTYLLIAGQATLGTVVDPWGHSWNPWGLGEYPLRVGFLLPAAVWWTQVFLIVAGHVLGIVAAHRVALARGFAPVRTLAYQLPLVLLMVGFTIAGLWVLAQQVHGS